MSFISFYQVLSHLIIIIIRYLFNFSSLFVNFLNRLITAHLRWVIFWLLEKPIGRDSWFEDPTLFNLAFGNSGKRQAFAYNRPIGKFKILF